MTNHVMACWDAPLAFNYSVVFIVILFCRCERLGTYNARKKLFFYQSIRSIPAYYVNGTSEIYRISQKEMSRHRQLIHGEILSKKCCIDLIRNNCIWIKIIRSLDDYLLIIAESTKYKHTKYQYTRPECFQSDHLRTQIPCLRIIIIIWNVMLK